MVGYWVRRDGAEWERSGVPEDCQLCPAGPVSGGPQDRLWWQCHLAESYPILPPGIFIPGPNERCRTNRTLPMILQGPCLACSPLCLQVTRCAFSRIWLRATKNNMSQCLHASAAGTPCAPPCLPALSLPPSSPRGCVTGTALPQSGCRSGWVMPEPCSCSMPLRRVLPTLGRGRCHSGCWCLCFLLCWAQPLVTRNLQANTWLANNATALWPCLCCADIGVRSHGTVCRHGL